MGAFLLSSRIAGLHPHTQLLFLCDENIHNALPAILNDMTSVIVWSPFCVIEENVFASAAVTLYLLRALSPSCLTLLIVSPSPVLTQM